MNAMADALEGPEPAVRRPHPSEALGHDHDGHR
jgi:hypothetical protein